MAHAVTRMADDSIRFTFYDAQQNYFSVPLKQTQVDEYRDVLDLFSTNPLNEETRKERKILKKEKKGKK